jgi:hypothetical protein
MDLGHVLVDALRLLEGQGTTGPGNDSAKAHKLAADLFEGDDRTGEDPVELIMLVAVRMLADGPVREAVTAVADELLARKEVSAYRVRRVVRSLVPALANRDAGARTAPPGSAGVRRPPSYFCAGRPEGTVSCSVDRVAPAESHVEWLSPDTSQRNNISNGRGARDVPYALVRMTGPVQAALQGLRTVDRVRSGAGQGELRGGEAAGPDGSREPASCVDKRGEEDQPPGPSSEFRSKTPVANLELDQAGRLTFPSEIRAQWKADMERGVRAGKVFRLLPRHDVYLFAPTNSRDDGDRFAGFFRETWGRLPMWARRRFLKHWRTDPFPPPLLYSPVIELLPGWSGRKAGRGLRGDAANVSCRGHLLRFWTRCVAAFPDDLVRDLIAHELAHVYQWSIGDDLETMDNFEAESLADQLVEDWGFSADAMDEWMLANGHIKVIDLESLSPSQARRHKRNARRAGRY